jgi:16S rRNA (guanine527-N7)-methyltransferase
MAASAAAADAADTVLTAEAIARGGVELGVPIDTQQTEKLLAFVQLLRRWNTTFNLTAVDRPEQILTHHLFDCLAIVPALLRLPLPESPRVLDVGSGAGLPGLVLAIVLPRWRLVLIDKVGKKTAFLTQAAIELQLTNLEVIHGRVENLAREPKFDLIVSRAFSALADFVGLTRPLLRPGGYWASMKGAQDESVASIAAVEPVEIVRLRVPQLAAQRQLVLLRQPSSA